MSKLLSFRERNIFLVTMSVVGFFIFFRLFLIPAFERNSTLDNEIRLAKAKYIKYRQLLAQKDQLRAQAAPFPLLLKNSSTTGRRMESALFELQGLAKNANLQLLDIRPQGGKEAGKENEVLIDLKTEGMPLAYLKFLYDIEGPLSLFEVKSFLLKSKFNSAVIEGSFTISRLNL